MENAALNTRVSADRPSRRVFLFLQGPSSPIFRKIADRLESYGHTCLRINLNVGDEIIWRRKGASNYRGRAEDWPDYLARFIGLHQVTDMILLGEERPYHQAATAVARRTGVAIAIVEMGYLRPDWLTLERDGMSSNSHFPADAAHIVEAAKTLPEPDWRKHYSQTFLADASYDLLYNLPNVFLWFLFPHYRRHAIFHPLAEYAGWIRRLFTGKRRSAEAEETVRILLSERVPFFVYPLQLETDFQLRAHSPFHSQKDAIDEVMHSFAADAARETRLVFKVHPLDNDLIAWRKFIDDKAAELGLTGRVFYLDGGNLDVLAEASAGMVTVNSTAGLHALKQGRPVRVLGTAVFDIAGLTDQQPLEDFWQRPTAPDAEVSSAMFRLLAASIQVRGNLYSRTGTDAGARAIAERLHENTVNQPGAFIDPPPRRKPQKRQRPASRSA
ncbi:capsular biosynthesis protein [Ensifer sp. T173]|jgi:capsular polysaccharide export protein|uniref:Capsular biosynthesis protein n=1 Tax=Ensifer canadensis TaxID=555315 RepID=A0AAW4FDK9_9HYPH|nr:MULTISPECIES: capsule biosynthesis protein [Ensifer]KQW84925.1 capsular biosynthesis protein [Ensifer sp. Root127]PSS66923.1 capsular biosynthesis protein [Ensifer sp. NM-2]KQY71314.1 capsular biosynthesis protein [Ensifer sp. Root142]MBD9486105.1 capsular biosynthesis protein [Ensifer sp. ENS11]MBM3090240.1 capsular biosynthesis protein [Ensifer canadensis]